MVKELNSGLLRTNPDSSGVENLNQGSPDFKSCASLRVAVPSPEEKRKGGNVNEKLIRIVLCDVKVIYVSYVNKLYFPGKSVCTHVLTQTNLFSFRFLFGFSTFFRFTLVCEGHFMLCYQL